MSVVYKYSWNYRFIFLFFHYFYETVRTKYCLSCVVEAVKSLVSFDHSTFLAYLHDLLFSFSIPFLVPLHLLSFFLSFSLSFSHFFYVFHNLNLTILGSSRSFAHSLVHSHSFVLSFSLVHSVMYNSAFNAGNAGNRGNTRNNNRRNAIGNLHYLCFFYLLLETCKKIHWFLYAVKLLLFTWYILLGSRVEK